MENKIKIGVLGAGRGKTMVDFCLKTNEAELVAVCDFNDYYLSEMSKIVKNRNINVKLFSDFEDFIKVDMDAVVLANYANDHAPFAIRCLNMGKHVISEVLPCETLKEAVELCEAVENSGKIYYYAENYCFFGATREMKRLYQNGTLGEFRYGEGEYIHNCESIWGELTNADRNHWRNTKSAFFYSTHSAGPLIHITGLRPIKVQGIEGAYTEKMRNIGAGGASVAVEMVTLDNGGMFKSIHGGGLSENSIWYTIFGDNCQVESARECTKRVDATNTVYLSNHKTKTNPFGVKKKYSLPIIHKGFGHCGSDYYPMHNFLQAIKGQPAEIINVYEALDMFFVGHFGYFSALNGGVITEIPNFRNKAEREVYRNDTRCCTKSKGGEQTLPSNTQGGMDTSDDVYVRLKKELVEKRAVKQTKRGILYDIYNRIRNLFVGRIVRSK